jgi:hypothetical protein
MLSLGTQVKSNETKPDEIPEAKLEGIHETKQNFTLYEQNKTKRNNASFCFAKQAKFHGTTFLFRFVLCFVKQ